MIHPDDVAPLIYSLCFVLFVTFSFCFAEWRRRRTDNSQPKDAHNGTDSRKSSQEDQHHI